MSAVFSLDKVSKSFMSRAGLMIPALENMSLEALEGQITCLVGPTGSGKSTALRILAGLEASDAGEASVAGKPPLMMQGRVGYLSQEHTLLPWLPTWANVAMPLIVRGVRKHEARARAFEICGILGLAGYEELYPYELSGGMARRADLGRLLASEAIYWLVDEPFTSLDEKTQHVLQSLLFNTVAKHNITMLFVTHSIDEAVYLAERVLVLSGSPGRVIEDFRLSLPRPRVRASAEYGAAMERIRRKIESLL